jgi:uncharacterized membrane protein
MASEGTVMGISLLGVVAGLAVLLYGTELGDYTVIGAGGVVVLLGVGLMTAYLSGLEGPAESH